MMSNRAARANADASVGDVSTGAASADAVIVGAVSVGAVNANADADADATIPPRRLSPAAFTPLLDHHLPPTERFRAND